MFYCTDCGAEVGETWAHCRSCGAEQPTTPSKPSKSDTPRTTASQKSTAPVAPAVNSVVYMATPKSKETGVLLAIFLSHWSWVYTYKLDAAKFWGALIGGNVAGWAIGSVLVLSTKSVSNMYLAYIPLILIYLLIWILAITDAVNKNWAEVNAKYGIEVTSSPATHPFASETKKTNISEPAKETKCRSCLGLNSADTATCQYCGANLTR